MARFKVVDMSPRLLPVVLEQQLVPGTFEYALHALIDSEFDFSVLAAQFKNDAMRQRIDSAEGRALYGRRIATVEPVFGNLRNNKGLDRFTLRGRRKVDTQWKLYCMVHNIEKLAHHGYAQ